MKTNQIKVILLWVFKIATLIISAPASVGVAMKLNKVEKFSFSFDNFFLFSSEVVSFLVIIASLLAIEFAFLYLWQVAEDKHQQSKDEMEVIVHVAGVWLMYVVIIVLGFLYSGAFDFSSFVYDVIGTICFRFTIGLILFFATYDTLLRTRQRIAEAVASGKQQSRKVIQRQKNANDEIAIVKIDVIEEETKKAIESRRDEIYQIVSAQVSRELLESKTNNHKSKQQNEKAKAEIVVSKVQNDSANMEVAASYDHKLFTVVPVNDGWLMQCKVCDEKHVKETRISAIRTGSSHSKKHKVLSKKKIKVNKKQTMAETEAEVTSDPKSPSEPGVF